MPVERPENDESLHFTLTMIYGPAAAKCPIRKQVLNAGKEPPIEFCNETKVCSIEPIEVKNFCADFFSFYDNDGRWNGD